MRTTTNNWNNNNNNDNNDNNNNNDNNKQWEQAEAQIETPVFFESQCFEPGLGGRLT